MSEKNIEPRPDGRIEIRATYLEMCAPRADAPPAAPPGASLHIMRAVRPTVSFYRYLFNTVGGPWRWTTRRLQSDEQVRRSIHDDDTEIFVPYVDGVPVGFAELDCRRMPDIELLCFGFVPEFVGRRLGPVLLRHAIGAAFARGAKRFWLHTCSMDHPKAVAFYQRAGFVVYQEETKWIDDPREVLART